MSEQLQPNDKPNHNGVVFKSIAVVFGMLAFVFVGLVPMYNLICEWTGLTGKTAGKYELTTTDTSVDMSRTIKVQFLANNNEGMPWQFRPVETSVEVHPGELKTVYFYAKNETGKDMIGQAVPSLSPFNLTEYFHKTECFCFQQQPLAGGEDAEMGLQFIVDKEIPADVELMTLSYTLFDVTQMASAD